MPQIATLQRGLSEAGLDAAVLTSYEMLTPFARTDIVTQLLVPQRIACFVVPASGPTTLVVCTIEHAEASATTIADEVRGYVEFEEDPIDLVAEILTELGFAEGRVGVELGRLAGLHLDNLRERLPRLRIERVDEIARAAASVKLDHELATLGVHALATQRAAERAADTLVPGRTEREAFTTFMSELVKTGGRPEFTVFGSGEGTFIGHPTPTDAPLREGALWRVDFGCRYTGGFVSDVARTGVVGEPEPEQEELMAAVIAAQRAAIDTIEPGRPARDLFRALVHSLEGAGLTYDKPHIGHGLGYGIHEEPALEPGNDTPLEVGMALCVEPLVSIPHRREAYHTEDLVAVTEDGHRFLTEPQDGLLRITG
jgi:Xaa-Pro aminopeptidase